MKYTETKKIDFFKKYRKYALFVLGKWNIPLDLSLAQFWAIFHTPIFLCRQKIAVTSHLKIGPAGRRPIFAKFKFWFGIPEMNQFRIVVCFGMPKMILYKMSRAEFEYLKYFPEKCFFKFSENDHILSTFSRYFSGLPGWLMIILGFLGFTEFLGKLDQKKYRCYSNIHKCSFESLSPKVLKDISFLFCSFLGD